MQKLLLLNKGVLLDLGSARRYESCLRSFMGKTLVIPHAPFISCVSYLLSSLLSLGMGTKKAQLQVGKVCHRLLSLAYSSTLLSIEKKKNLGSPGHKRSGRCEAPSLPLPPFLPSHLRLLWRVCAGSSQLWAAFSCLQLLPRLSEEQCGRLLQGRLCSECCLYVGFQPSPHPTAAEVMADSLASA